MHSVLADVQQLKVENDELKAIIKTLQCHVNAELNRQCDHVTSDALGDQQERRVFMTSTSHPGARGQYTAFACTENMVVFSCPDGREIFVTNATYAQYKTPYADCSRYHCPPNPAIDCTELVEENRAHDWRALKLFCDKLNWCEFKNMGSVINKCETDYTSDYMQVFYDCLPDDVTGPVGFTAYANTGNSIAYYYNDVIIFDEVVSNFGGHYNPKTGSFVCPADGVYIISVHVLARTTMVADIMRNSDKLVGVRIDRFDWQLNSGSGTIVVHGSRGDVIWMRHGYNAAGRIYATDRRTFFTCYLLYRY